MAVNGGHAGTKKGPNWGHVTSLVLEASLLSKKASHPSAFGGFSKTLQRSNSLSRSVSGMAGSFGFESPTSRGSFKTVP